MKVAVIVAAAGKGERLKSKIHKPFVMLGKEPILAHALKALDASNLIGEIIITVHQADLPRARAIVKKGRYRKIKDVVAGGKRRMDSVKNGLAAVSEDAGYVIIHDGCRPFIDNKMIAAVLDAAETFGGAVTAMPIVPTVKEVEKGDFVSATLDRQVLVEVQTPQAFRKDLLLRAYERAFAENVDATDDAALVERTGIKVKVVKGSYVNLKITTPEDLKYAKMLMGEK